MDVLRRDYGPDDLHPLLAAAGRGGSIAVQAVQTEEENAALLELADRSRTILGVVGWVDLRSPEVDHALARFAAHPRAVGVRHLVQDEPDDRFLLGEEFLRGVGRCAAHDLAYDLLIHERQLPVAIEFVRRLPEARLVLDHLAKPKIASGELEPWRMNIAEIARAEHLTAKVSGLVTEADWTRWTPADLRPYLDVALEAFGPERLMLGSDWPVCRLASEYDLVFEAMEPWLADLSPAERAAIEGGTAARVYGV